MRASSAVLALLGLLVGSAVGYWLGSGGPGQAAAPPAAPRPQATLPAVENDDELAGRWREARDAGETIVLGERDERDEAMLAGLGYADGYEVADDSRPVVPVHDRERAQAGFNFFTSGHGPVALLADMDGNVLHRWERSPADVWPDYFADEANSTANKTFFRRAHLFPSGDVVAIFSGLGLVRLDAQSNVLWAVRGGYHHEVAVDAAGTIWALDREKKVLPRLHKRLPVLEDFVVALGPDGVEQRRFSLVECFERSEYRGILDFIPVAADIFHTNSIDVLDGSLFERHPAFRAGNLLISIRHTNTVAVVDPVARSVPWALSGNWRRQHDPELLPSGNLLLLDNMASATSSRAVEIDPFTQRTVWQFTGSEAVPFHSRTCGTAKRLANGNTLLTESDYGRAIEVTPDGEVVWEFVSPYRAGDSGGLVATLFELVRLPADFPVDAFVTGR